VKSKRTSWLILLALGGVVALTSATSTDDTVTHIPGAAHVSGANNTVWRTDLELRSVSSLPAQVRIDLLRKNRDNTNHPAVVVNIDPGTAQRFDDVLDLLFGFEGSATLRLNIQAGDVRATSRTYNLTPEGTYGQSIGASQSTDAFALGRDATLIQLSSSPDPALGFRTNIGLVSLVGFPINMEVDLHRADASYLGRISTTLEPFEFDQINDVFGEVASDAVDDGFAIVRTTTFGAEYLTYASVIDNRTGDPVYMPGLDAGSGVGPTLTPSPTPGTPTPTPTPSATPTPIPVDPVVVTTLDGGTVNLEPWSIVFRVGNSSQTSLILCSFDGTISQVASSNFSFIRGPTETVEWGNCCANFGARLQYETWVGVGGNAVARTTCTAGDPYFAIAGTELETGDPVEIDGEDLDIAIWP
jgi:hypothetical protein